MRRSAVGVVITAGAAALVGISACGGSSDSRSSAAGAHTTINAAFISEADAVCARAKNRVDVYGRFPHRTFDPLHPDAKLLSKVGAFFEQSRPTRDRLPVELHRLGLPRRGAAVWARLLTLLKQNRVINDRQIAAALASDASAFVPTVDEAERSHEQIQQLGRRAGFSDSSPCKGLY